MPNHIANRLTITAETSERLEEVINALRSGSDDICFNNLIPMPEGLNINNYGHSTEEKKWAISHTEYDKEECEKLFGKRFDEEMFKNARQQEMNRIRTGYPTWYEWRCAFWGTKWDAYDTVIDYRSDKEITYLFNTAWNAPLPIFVALAEKFKDIEFSVMWADEDMGCNCGTGYAHDGEFGWSFEENESDSAYEIYFELNEWARDYYEKVDGKWRYVEDLGDEEEELEE